MLIWLKNQRMVRYRTFQLSTRPEDRQRATWRQRTPSTSRAPIDRNSRRRCPGPRMVRRTRRARRTGATQLAPEASPCSAGCSCSRCRRGRSDPPSSQHSSRAPRRPWRRRQASSHYRRPHAASASAACWGPSMRGRAAARIARNLAAAFHTAKKYTRSRNCTSSRC